MTCLLCKQGETSEGVVNVPLERGQAIIIFRGVPAQVCDNCGEYYLSGEVTARLLERAEQAVQSGAEVEILRFAA